VHSAFACSSYLACEYFGKVKPLRRTDVRGGHVKEPTPRGQSNTRQRTKILLGARQGLPPLACFSVWKRRSRVVRLRWHSTLPLSNRLDTHMHDMILQLLTLRPACRSFRLSTWATCKRLCCYLPEWDSPLISMRPPMYIENAFSCSLSFLGHPRLCEAFLLVAIPYP
jgi:hypothetical protein